MNGFFIRYTEKSTTGITSLNNLIFGRVVTIKDKDKKRQYYYAGKLDLTLYYKLSNGSYFIANPYLHRDFLSIDGIEVLSGTLQLPRNAFITAREHYSNANKGNVVKNL